VLLANGFHGQAAEALAHAERFDPKDPRWPYYRGTALLAQTDESGFVYLRRAVELADRFDPDNSGPRLTLAEQLLTLGQFDEAEQVLAVVAEKDPDDPRLHFSQAVLAEFRGEHARAIKLFQSLLGHTSARVKAASRLAAIYTRLGQPQRAAEYSQMVKAFPADENWDDTYLREYASLGVSAQRRLGEFTRDYNEDNLQDAYEKALKLIRDSEGKNDVAHFVLANTLIRMGRLNAAERAVRKALSINPNKAQSLYTLGVVLYFKAHGLRMKGGVTAQEAPAKYREAIGYFRRALRLKPNDSWSHLYMGRALLEMGERKEAIKALRVAVAIHGEAANAQYFLGEALLQDGQLAEARGYLERAVELAHKDDKMPAEAMKRLVEAEKKAGRRP
jgi:tetratricopeptide (TPR) repeat protein